MADETGTAEAVPRLDYFFGAAAGFAGGAAFFTLFLIAGIVCRYA
jgi:hypothetical protein